MGGHILWLCRAVEFPLCWLCRFQVSQAANSEEYWTDWWLICFIFNHRYLKWDMKSWSPKTFLANSGRYRWSDRVHQIWAGRSPPSIASCHCGASGLAAGGGNDPVGIYSGVFLKRGTPPMGHQNHGVLPWGFTIGVLPCFDLREYVIYIML